MKIIDAIASMTFEDEVDDEDLVSGAVVLLHTIRARDGQEAVVIATSDGLGAFTADGLVYNAVRILNQQSEDDE